MKLGLAARNKDGWMSVTTVPLRPVGKGGIAVVWLGVLGLMALGFWFAVQMTPRIGFETVKAGEGPSPGLTDIALVKYEGRLTNGTVFDQADQAPFPVGQVVPGFTKALQKMQKGGKYKVTIPPTLGYGAKANGPIPANSTLIFDVELLDFRSEAEVRAMQQMMEQMRGAGAEGAAPPPPEAREEHNHSAP